MLSTLKNLIVDPSFSPEQRPTNKKIKTELKKALGGNSGLSFVASEGFEPPKAEPSDLQSDPFGR